jgi:uncharacterized protein (DUF934 family)
MTRQIIKNRAINEDRWIYIGDDETLPSDGNTDIIVTLKHWQNSRDILIARKGGLGIQIGSGISVEDIKDDLAHFNLVAIRFHEFKDGRGYSYARLLRERYGFKKEIRAFGDVLRDQLLYMERCGFTAFDLREGSDLNKALKAFDELTVRYQPATDGPATPAII